MIFNFSKKYQFCTSLTLNGQVIETLDKTRLLGTIVSNNIKWDENTAEIVKKANRRMELLRKVATFNPQVQDLKIIYFLFIRSILEQSAVVWHSSLSNENSIDPERVQKSALKIILGERYKGYKYSLDFLGIQTLKERRRELCLKFAKKCLNNPKLKDMFPVSSKTHSMITRKPEKYVVERAKTERYRNSPLIYMKMLLNQESRTEVK